MDIRSLRYFIAAVQQGSLTKASAVLCITQPALSRTFRELEEELGQKLFERGARSITLTSAGETLYQRALSLIEMFEATRAELTAPHQPVQGTVRIIAGESAGNSFLTDLFAGFHRQYPQVRLKLLAGDEGCVQSMLASGAADFGVLFFSDGRGFDAFDYVLLPYQDSWGLITADPELADCQGITPDLLKTRPLICSEQIFLNDELRSWLGAPVSSLQIQATYSLIYNAWLLARSGFGDLLCFKDLAPLLTQDTLHFIPLTPALTVRSALVWPKAFMHSTAALKLLSFLQAALRRNKTFSAVPAAALKKD